MTRRHTFEYDWFTHVIPLFDNFLADLRGTPCRVLEIGSHEGRSTTWLLDHILTHPGASIDTIDMYTQPNFWHNIAVSDGLNKIHYWRGDSLSTLRGLPNSSYDFVYIDGSHSTVQVLEDAVLSFRLAKAGGVIAFDDYLWDDPQFNQDGTPKKAIDAFLDIYAGRIEVLHKGVLQVWVRKLRD